jgi:hypothetical protein
MESGELAPKQARNPGGGGRKFLPGRGDLLYSWRSILHSPFSILYGNSLSSQLQSRSGVENSDWRMENFRMEIYSLLRHECVKPRPTRGRVDGGGAVCVRGV